jgi:oligopeptidase A
LPENLFEKLLSTKKFQAGLQMARQLVYSLFDFQLHHSFNFDDANGIKKILDELRKEYLVIPTPEFNRFQNSFMHIFSGEYAAGYYSYKWAEVLSSDAFSRFEEEGIFNPKTGKSFLETVLEQGGSKPAMDIFVEFRGRKPTIDALLRHTFG